MGGVVSFLEKPLSTLFGGDKKADKPEAADPRRAPLPEDEAAKKARRRAQLAALQRTGRASTILTDSSDTLGG